MVSNRYISLFIFSIVVPCNSVNGDSLLQEPKLFLEVGTVGNKTFFAEVLALTNWVTAYSRCLERGMFLATIETQEERDLLRAFFIEAGIPNWSTLPETSKFESEFWVAGTDFGSPENFYWLENGRNITESTVVGKVVCGTSRSYRCTCCCGAPCTPTYETCRCYPSNCSCSNSCTGSCVIVVHHDESKTTLRTVGCKKNVKMICQKYNN